MPEEKQIDDKVIDLYKELIVKKYPELQTAWPVTSGCNRKIGTYKDWLIIIYEHTGNPSFTTSSGFGEVTEAIVGVANITEQNKKNVRQRIEKHFKVGTHDAVIFLQKQEDGNWNISDELDITLTKHEFSMGVVPMRIFLSHKGADKPIVREYKKTLELLGFSPWLDEDAMNAGSELERSILQGFSDSCAAIFFITPRYKDENFLATEIDYAIQEKRKKGDKFSIITLVFEDGDQTGVVPELLHRYVWKQPADSLEAIREILKSLPIQTGEVYWK